MHFIKKHSTDLLHKSGKDEKLEGGDKRDEVIAGESRTSLDSVSGESPFQRLSFKVGVTENRNSHYRQSMEDVHTYVANFAERLDWGYFAIFDGHAGKQTARWCGANLHNLLYDNILKDGTMDLRENLNETFHEADDKICDAKIAGSSGCTAAVAVLRWEEEVGADAKDEETKPNEGIKSEGEKKDEGTKQNGKTMKEEETKKGEDKDENLNEKPSGKLNSNNSDVEKPAGDQSSGEPGNNIEKIEGDDKDDNNGKDDGHSDNHLDSTHPFDFIPTKRHKRMLYTANVGDSRIILSRKGHAVRLSYDHKSTDQWEQKRIVDSGGIMLKCRVNGVLAITRALGDCYMKNLVIGSPFTTATEITDEDEFLIIACDGLWDVCTDQQAVDMVRNIKDPKKASSVLVNYAINQMTTDNVTAMVIRLDTRVFTCNEN